MNAFEMPRVDNKPADPKIPEGMIKVADARDVEVAGNPPYANPGPATPEDVGMIEIPKDAPTTPVEQEKAA